MSDNPLITGVDIGGTKIAIGIAGPDGRLLAERRQLSDVQRGPDAVVDDIIALVRDAAHEAGGEIGFVGVACPGPLSQKRGVILDTPNLPGWREYPLIEKLTDALGALAVLENDAKAACLGEALFGAGVGKRFVAYFTVSTGVGGGFVQDGRVLHGSDGNATEFGHQTIVAFDGAPCPCGKFGHVEAYASGTSIARRAREALAAGEKSMLTDIADSSAQISARLIAEAANRGDALANRLWQETAVYLGIGLVNVIHQFNPDIVVLGGGVMHVGDLLMKPLRAVVDERVMPDYKGSFTIETATLGDRVGVMGAIGLARQHGVSGRLTS